MKSKRNTGITYTLLVLLSLFWGALAHGANYSNIVIFGDSLSDSGGVFNRYKVQSTPPFQLIPSAPYARGGHHFTNGQTWAEMVATDLGLSLSARPAFWLPAVGNNYAMGGARGRLIGDHSFLDQVNRFLGEAGQQAPGDALYTVFFGGNDLRDALQQLQDDEAGATSFYTIYSAVGYISWGIESLIMRGARTFVVPNVPDLATTPAVGMFPDEVIQTASLFTFTFNELLSAELEGLRQTYDVDIIRPDIYSRIYEVLADPASVGLSNVSDSCIVPDVVAGATCAQPDSYLFWDGIHPTTAGHQIIAAEVMRELSQ